MRKKYSTAAEKVLQKELQREKDRERKRILRSTVAGRGYEKSVRAAGRLKPKQEPRTPKQIAEGRKIRNREAARKRRADPERRERENELRRISNSLPENRQKARVRDAIWRAGPEFKEWILNYLERPEVKKALTELRQSPEYKAASRERARIWRSVPENRERRNSAARERSIRPEVVAARRFRYRNDHSYRLKTILRSRTAIAVRQAKLCFNSGVPLKAHVSAVRDLGCSIPQLIEHLESQFKEGMSWKNHGNKAGQWSIDHIRPFASFDMSDPEQVKQAVHYTNLQPMWHSDNLKKGARCL